MQTGNYTFTVVSNATGQPAVALNNPMTLTVFPAASAADASSFTVAAPTAAVGASADVVVHLRDRFGQPLNSTSLLLSLQGEVLVAVFCCTNGL